MRVRGSSGDAGFGCATAGIAKPKTVIIATQERLLIVRSPLKPMQGTPKTNSSHLIRRERVDGVLERISRHNPHRRHYPQTRRRKPGTIPEVANIPDVHGTLCSRHAFFSFVVPTSYPSWR